MKAAAVRVAATRITLDLVVARFEEGACPEEIVHSYDTLHLEDVYAVIAYYLRHKDEVLAYLRGAAKKRRRRSAESWRRREFPSPLGRS